MANNINREGFKRFLELGAPSFEGNIILDSGELSEYYYRFMRIPLAYGEHKVDVLYGQRFYGTLENKPVTFNQEIQKTRRKFSRAVITTRQHDRTLSVA